MSEPFSWLTIWTLLKTLVPNIVGGAIALWKVKDEVTWSDKTTSAKVFTIFMTPLVFVFAVIFGYYFGGAILEMAVAYVDMESNPLTYAFIMILTTASSLRFLRMFMVRIEEIFELFFTGVKSVIRRIFKLSEPNKEDNKE